MKSVYSVVNRDGVVVYVGCTKNLKQREHQHRAYNPEADHLEILEQVEDTEAKERESYWIYKFIDEGMPLKNKENKKAERWSHQSPISKELPKSGIAILSSDKTLIDDIVKMTGIFSYRLVGMALREWAQVHGYQYLIEQLQGGSDATSV